MFSKHYQILDMDYSITPGHWADVTQRFISSPAFDNYTHICGVDNSITINVYDWNDWRLPDILQAIAARNRRIGIHPTARLWRLGELNSGCTRKAAFMAILP